MREAEKNALRREMKALRRMLSADEKSSADAAICRLLLDRRDIGDLAASRKGGAPLAVYLAAKDEIDMDPFIEHMLRLSVDVVAPRWNGKAYELSRLKGLDEKCLRIGPMGIREPLDGDILPPGDVHAWIVPGIAFTRDGRRLGYGGGWYDRFLASASPEAVKIGVAYSFQIVADLPLEPHDIPLNDVCVAQIGEVKGKK